MKVIVTGGAGFIGVNTAARFHAIGASVVVFDNLSRKGSRENLQWLKDRAPAVVFVQGDIRDRAAVDALMRAHDDVDCVIHLAGQVAVTTSIVDPVEDFAINATGTLNILESLRVADLKPLLLYSSTNKVYGDMHDVAITEDETRYRYADFPCGVAETFPIDFHSPYGCSKGAADQYVHDYSRIYGLPTVVLRQSCIYGYRQLGVEDQGWVAWFLIAAALGKPVTIYGDGKQVRDILFVDDLVDLYLRCYERKEMSAGKIYNVGGGPAYSVSIWHEFGQNVERLIGRPMEVKRDRERPGDQKVFVSDIRKLRAELDWTPTIEPEQGIQHLYDWVLENKSMLQRLF